MKFFFDESGNTGGETSTGKAYDFDGQPTFALAAIGLHDQDATAAVVEEIRSAHRIPAGELKSKSLTGKPEFVRDLVDAICDRAPPCFIEVVDKRFYVVMNMVSSHVLPPSTGILGSPQAHFVQNAFADFLYHFTPAEVFDAFIAACQAPSDAALRSSFGALLEFLDRFPASEVAVACREMTCLSLSDYDEMLADKVPTAYARFLPSPDTGKRGKPVSMLPNLSSLTNIYARINRHYKRDLSAIELVHDEQLQYDQILTNNKQAAEALGEHAVNFFTPHADYKFSAAAPLTFAKSHDSIGLQLADVIAGFCMRYIKDWLCDPRGISDAAHATFERLRGLRDNGTVCGVNLVVTNQLAHQVLFPAYRD
ncbi:MULTISPECIES: DUF3800 domain-containing protein [Ralstonia]|uniref:DUF3800 domain-containing protein n=1 Tax=Ralstonia mannitolilytica TaxID=105219 RepID=A0AAD2B5G5_9RALS|nr:MULTISPECIES: DUF3800 domain-containing protein [Ralstonia]EPX94476.1 hypothetical protein C404_28665 [Ralstonia sp. AU12-08]MBA4202879.1 DUF3800 domain-containing protein [Ralstonia sp.]MBA4233476.1 DUF3800 domain-containing protein [Ralstonia sp.]MBA4238063.1 DUF3800 domain-containing protein [Ralstonia sp.]MBA4279147.1 DUF3800 domain-containing protein [Ralstonia sp.]